MAAPFFLKTGTGERFCLYHPPAEGKAVRKAFVYIHPFAEEMNKARRMAALQSRAFAQADIAVLQIDLYGCGDSSGDFGDARWDIWRDDVLAAAAWLENRCGVTVGLWGLRMGALLALDTAASAARPVDELILWQPVTNGETFLTQFLRMRLAGEMLANGAEKSGGTQELRERMAAGESLEVAGYELSPALAASLDSLNAAKLAPAGIPVHWFELVAEEGRPMPPASARIASAWEERGVQLQRHVVAGPAFWSSQEIAECPALLAATTRLSDEVPA
ncbi:hydrolase 2, exosortase A system-associated [Noviherbaspirillum denitrificans]|uniref:Esterase n=1 Tax=Noviherbaspirillum denitrificans TaxID=1968433 RepID=A0A254TJ62_9BURK|nr:hydrolase 2, exosortase A system-associated [Noviherbaspirillum denitrificans]OWW22247.1 esterase [Noviherbaspirillum denitrificans]